MTQPAPPQPTPPAPPPHWQPLVGHRPPLPPPVSPAGQPLASFVDRLLAYLIDAGIAVAVLMVIAVPAMVVVFVATLPDQLEVRPDGTVTDPDLWPFFLGIILLDLGIIAVGAVLTYVYYVEMMFRSGQTVGKKVMKIKIVPLDPAATLTRGHAVKRWLVFWVAGTVLPFFSYLDGLWQLWDKPYQQCLHDKFAETVVVKVPA
ncbi:RDD family protein [Actinomycetes bacterium KLBMP 9797]